METVIPSKAHLKGRSHDEVKRILMLAGFRPVRKGELPEVGDRVINCNILYSRNYGSDTSLQSGVVTLKYNAPYYVVYDKITWEHAYSKSWFERVVWIRKKEVINKPTEQKMAEERADYMVGTCIYTNTTKTAMDEVLRGLSNGQAGKTFTCYKLVPVAIACKPVEPKQVQWL